MQNQLLLLEDIDNLGRKGEVVQVKPGFARNYLVPQRKAVVVDKRTLRMQEKLKEERAKQAAVDKKESQALAEQLKDKTFEVKVKVDPDGHMYGSVSASDIAEILAKEGFVITKKNVKLAHPIKKTGVHPITLNLKEGIEARFALKVYADHPVKRAAEKKPVDQVEEEQKEPEQTSAE